MYFNIICSVLLNIYFRNINPSIAAINEQFQTAFSGSQNTNLVDTFQGRRAIVISTDTYGQTNQNVHPGAFSSEGRFPANTDPTLRAVVLGTYVGKHCFIFTWWGYPSHPIENIL